MVLNCIEHFLSRCPAYRSLLACSHLNTLDDESQPEGVFSSCIPLSFFVILIVSNQTLLSDLLEFQPMDLPILVFVSFSIAIANPQHQYRISK